MKEDLSGTSLEFPSEDSTVSPSGLFDCRTCVTPCDALCYTWGGDWCQGSGDFLGGCW